jgi:hypothetical protein
MKAFVPEILQDINERPETLVLYKDEASICMVLNATYRPENKFLLPEGDPPFKPDSAPLGMTPAVFKNELRKLYIYCRTDLTPARREDLFIQFLENIHPSEAKVLLAIKDQDLTKLYPNITHQLVYDAGIIANPPPVVEKSILPKATKPKKSTGAAA